LEAWDCRVEAESVGAALFNVFFWQWCRTVVRERLEGETAEFLATAAWGLAAALLHEDAAGWFCQRSREQAVHQAFVAALDELSARLGPDISGWSWGRLHVLRQRHFLSGRGSLGTLLDRGGVPVKGDGYTVCNTGFDPSHAALLGAGYRMVADLADPNCGLWAVDAGSASGHPGSPHYDDQLPTWLAGRYHYHSLAGGPAQTTGAALTLRPQATA
jgi:penicillin amidase